MRTIEGDGACEGEDDTDADALALPVTLFEDARTIGGRAPALPLREGVESTGLETDAEEEQLRVPLPVAEEENESRLFDAEDRRVPGADADADPDALGESIAGPEADPEPDALPEALALPLAVTVCDGSGTAEWARDAVAEDGRLGVRVSEALGSTVDFCDVLGAWLGETACDTLAEAVGVWETPCEVGEVLGVERATDAVLELVCVAEVAKDTLSAAGDGVAVALLDSA